MLRVPCFSTRRRSYVSSRTALGFLTGPQRTRATADSFSSCALKSVPYCSTCSCSSSNQPPLEAIAGDMTSYLSTAGTTATCCAGECLCKLARLKTCPQVIASQPDCRGVQALNKMSCWYMQAWSTCVQEQPVPVLT